MADNSSQFSSKRIMGDIPSDAGVVATDVDDRDNKNRKMAKKTGKANYTSDIILKLIDDFDSIYRGLHDRQDEDIKTYELDSYEFDMYSESVTYNEPRWMADSIIQLCVASILNLTIDTEEKDHDKETVIEQFHLSADKSSDEYMKQMLMGGKKATDCFHAAVRGWIVHRVTVYRDENDKLVVCIFPLDPRYVYWGVGMGGFKWCAYVTWRTKEEIELDYGYTEAEELDRVVDFWSENQNIILVGDREIQRKGHSIGYPPFVIIPCGNQPKVVGGTASDAKKHLKGWGESVFAGNRTLWPLINKVLSVWLSLVVKSHKPGGYGSTDDDTFKIDALPYGSGTVEMVPGDFKWIPVEPADVARTTPELFQVLTNATQKGGVPWAAIGSLWKGQELSGNALEELKEGLNKIVVPILCSLEDAYQQTSRMVEEQFMSYEETWQAEGFDTKGRHFFRAIEPDDISGNHSIKYEFLSITPQEESRNIAKAQIMKSAELADDEFIDTQIMKFQDPAGIEDGKLMQKAKLASWKIADLERIKAFRKKGNNLYADILTAEMQKRLQQEAMMGVAPTETPQPQPRQITPPSKTPVTGGF